MLWFLRDPAVQTAADTESCVHIWKGADQRVHLQSTYTPCNLVLSTGILHRAGHEWGRAEDTHHSGSEGPELEFLPPLPPLTYSCPQAIASTLSLRLPRGKRSRAHHHSVGCCKGDVCEVPWHQITLLMLLEFGRWNSAGFGTVFENFVL